ncbi:MAG: hypothetical protein ACR2L3_04505, partial [Actinomycetota bacterium]
LIPSGPGEDPLVQRLLELQGQRHVEGALIFVGGEISLRVAQALIRSARSFKLVTALSLPPQLFSAAAASTTHSDGIMLLERAGLRTLELGPSESLSAAWTAMWRTSGSSAVRAHEGGGVWDRKQELA